MAAPPDVDRLLAAVRQQGTGVLVPVHAQPGARREGVTGLHDGRLRIATTSAPESGRATQRLGELLAEALSVPPSRVVCAAGAAGRRKLYRVDGLSLAAVRERLREALA